MNLVEIEKYYIDIEVKEEEKNKSIPHSGNVIIKDDVFIGAGTMLIAPINISSNSRTGAGSVVNSDVDKNQTVVGIPAKPIKLNES